MCLKCRRLKCSDASYIVRSTDAFEPFRGTDPCALAIREEKGEHELLWSPVLRAEGQNVVMFHTHHELRLSESMLFAACVSNIEPGKPERDDLDELQVVCLKARRPKYSDVSYA